MKSFHKLEKFNFLILRFLKNLLFNVFTKLMGKSYFTFLGKTYWIIYVYPPQVLDEDK